MQKRSGTIIYTFGKIDILVNNYAAQSLQNNILNISDLPLKTTFFYIYS